MKIPLRRTALFLITLTVACLYFAPVAQASELITPEIALSRSPNLELTLGDHACDLQPEFAYSLTWFERQFAPEDLLAGEVVYHLGDNCRAVESRLRISQNATIWLAVRNEDDPKEWVELDRVSGDSNPPQLDRRGRFFGCGSENVGVRSCQVTVSVDGVTYRIEAPLRVVAPGTPRESRGGVQTVTQTVQPQTVSFSGAPALVESVQEAALPAVSGPTIIIPSVNLQSSITTFPLNGASWAINPWERNVGLLQGTSAIAGSGNVVLGAHSTYPDGSAGLFASLYGVHVGDEIILLDSGVERRFIVTSITRVSQTDVSIANPNIPNRVTLFTCDTPTFNAATGQYDGRLVVVAESQM